MLRYPGQRFEEILLEIKLRNGTVFIQKNGRMRCCWDWIDRIDRIDGGGSQSGCLQELVGNVGITDRGLVPLQSG